MMQPKAERDNARTLRVAAVQIRSENGRINDNLNHATPLIEQAKNEGAQVVLMPEFMPTGYFLGEDIWEAGEPAEGATVRWLKENSKRLGVWLGTSYLEAQGKEFYNTFVLTNPNGEVAGRVRKWNPAIWEAYFFKGESSSHAIDTPLGKLGVAICFDSHLADVATILSKQSVDIALLPHSYPVPPGSTGLFSGEAMIPLLEMLPIKKAMLLGVPVVLVNKCGPWVSPVPGLHLTNTTGSRFPGRSTIVDSDGSIKARMGDEEGVIVADVTIDPTRKKHPVVPHYGRYFYPGPPMRSILRLIESMGRLSYLLSSKRKSKAAAISSAGGTTA